MLPKVKVKVKSLSFVRLLVTPWIAAHASKEMLKSFKLGFNSTWTVNFQMFKMDLEKAEEPETKLPIFAGSLKKQKSSRKTSTSGFWFFFYYAKAFDCIKVSFFKRWEYQPIWPASWEICIQVRKQQLEMDMKQQASSKSGKEYVKAVYCHLLI